MSHKGTVCSEGNCTNLYLHSLISPTAQEHPENNKKVNKQAVTTQWHTVIR